MAKLYDEYAAGLFEQNINLMVPWYLMAAYAYYEQDDPIVSDRFFDDLAKTIHAVWDDIEHRHKGYLNLEMLEAGTYIGDYPSIVAGAVEELRLSK